MEYLATEEASEPGGVEVLARRMAAKLAPSPIELLARHPEVDTAALVRAERIARFEARECRQLSSEDWRRETEAVLAVVQAVLAKRYARALPPVEKSPGQRQ